MKHIVMILTNWPDPETVEYSGIAYHDRSDALREAAEARTDPHVKYSWIRDVEEKPRPLKEWNIFKDRIGVTTNGSK